jgi:Cu(I)/Ag(I) efflux system membrane fusion protein
MRVFIILCLFLCVSMPMTVFALGSPAFAAAPLNICPMHPHISGPEGSACPICGMTLVPQFDDMATPSQSQTSEAGSFVIDPSYIHALGVKTTEVSHQIFGRDIRAFGRLAANMRLEHAVDARAKGWIVDLPVNAVGDRVKKGDLLYSYYSPELMEAQSDFLVGRRIGNAEQRLRLFGMDKRAIDELKSKGAFLEATPFYAAVDGTVTALNVRKGAHVVAGGNIMRLQDFSKIWVNVDVALRDAEFLALDTPAEILVPETGESFDSVIEFIHPNTDPMSRTVMVRLALDNAEGRLKTGSYVDAVFDAQVQQRIAVPAEAVLYGAMGAYVIEALGEGAFRPVMVRVGITADGFSEITSGLNLGQVIVHSGQFMLDAESNLKGGMVAMGHDHGASPMPAAKETAVKTQGGAHGQH